MSNRVKVLSSVSKAYDNNELILLNLNDGKMFGVDLIGTIIWDFIEKGYLLSDILNKLQVRFPEVELRILKGDLDEFINQLVKNKVVRLIK